MEMLLLFFGICFKPLKRAANTVYHLSFKQSFDKDAILCTITVQGYIFAN